MKTLYLCDIDDNKCIIHDGYIQLGVMSHNAKKHIELNPKINWIVVYWIPDIFTKRYTRFTYQQHMRVSSGKNTIEKSKS